MFSSILRETAGRGDIVVARAQSTSRGKKQLETKSLWRREVQARSVCSSGNLGTPDCREAGR